MTNEQIRDGHSEVLAEHSTEGSEELEPVRWGSKAQATHLREGEAGYNVSLEGTMGDTQRSQTISTEIQRIAKQEAYDTRTGSPLLVGESSLARIKKLADNNPEVVFTSLVHRIDLHLLKQSYRQVRKSKSAGVDKITAKQYAEDLDENLYNLHQRLRRGQYVATPVKRMWIDKEGGKQRPIGIPALEDKIVQRAASTIMAAVYDSIFYNFSHAFRKGHSQHQALKELRDNCVNLDINWIVSADIAGLFDNIDHGLLRELIKKRVKDGGLLRLIGKWLKAGVMEGGNIHYPESGTPQGGVISPMLSNIFLHYVLDDWFVKQAKLRLRGRCFIIRWADDFLIGCEQKEDAKRIMAVLPKRFERFRLNLHPEKTRLISFKRPDSSDPTKAETFDFLGFTFYWGKSLRGYWVIKKKTTRKRLTRFMKRIWQWCKDYRHDPIGEQHQMLCSKLRGYYQYFGVRSNYKALEVVFEFTEEAWRRWLGSRHRDGYISREKFKRIQKRYPLPIPRIVHNI